MINRKDTIDFSIRLARELPKWGGIRGQSELVERVLQLGQRYQTLQVKRCNQPQTERDKKGIERIEKEVAELLRPLGITPIFSSDPCGATIKLCMPSGYTNDMAQEGLCVPTS
jgi:hypothetical protein